MAQETFFFVDTSILLAHIRQKREPTILQLASIQYGKAVASVAVIFEIEVGARKRGRANEFETEFKNLNSYDITREIVELAAMIQADLIFRNEILGILDVFIAATAIHHKLPLLTLNTKHFERITDLTLLSIPER